MLTGRWQERRADRGFGAGVLGHVLSHWGEICALNGIHGGRGFPRQESSMAFNERLAERVRAVLDGRAGISERRMFGGLAFLLDGKMCVGVLGDELVVRSDAERYAESLKRPHARPMDFTGRSMTGMVYVARAGVGRGASLKRWVELGLEAANAAAPSKRRRKK